MLLKHNCTLEGHQQPFLAVAMCKVVWLGHVIRHYTLLNIILSGQVDAKVDRERTGWRTNKRGTGRSVCDLFTTAQNGLNTIVTRIIYPSPPYWGVDNWHRWVCVTGRHLASVKGWMMVKRWLFITIETISVPPMPIHATWNHLEIFLPLCFLLALSSVYSKVSSHTPFLTLKRVGMNWLTFRVWDDRHMLWLRSRWRRRTF